MSIEIPNIRTLNMETHEDILLQESCHCTTRTRTGTTSATARFNHNNEVAARIHWDHGRTSTIVSWNLPIGSFFTREIPYTLTREEKRAILLSGFLEMHTQWGGAEYSGLEDS